MGVVHRAGTLFCLASGAAFGAMAIFGKLAYEEGADAPTVLAARFLIAAAVFWAVLLARGRVGEVRALPRRDLRIALALGAVGYAAQAGLYFLALERVDASLLSLLLYTFPAMVAVAAVAIGRERFDGRRAIALVLASGGLALVVGGAGSGAIDPLGAALGLAAAATYTAYILFSDGVSGRVPPELLAAIVCAGAAASITVVGAALGVLHPGAVTLAGWGWLASLALVSTVAAIALFFAGLRRVGPTAAAIMSTVEPLVTVLLAFAVFGERLSALQLAGGALVIAAVPILHARIGRWRRLQVAHAEP
jgi:drug/metabolite transporter (DMT)-like permease